MKLGQLLLISLLLASRTGTAQTTPDTTHWPMRRWTVGTQLALYPRIAYTQATDDFVRPWPVLLTLAYRTKQRASIEVGLLLRAESTRGIASTNSQGTYTNQMRAISWAIPLITHVHLPLPNPGRWQMDFEFGIMPLSAKYRHETTFVDAQTGQVSMRGYSQTTYSDVHFIGGLGGGYALTPNLRLTADARVTFSVLLLVVSKALASYGGGRSSTPIFPALSTGVSYQFGAALP